MGGRRLPDPPVHRSDRAPVPGAASGYVGRLADVDAGRITIFRTVGAPPGETFEFWVNLADLTYHDVAHARLAVMDRGTSAACRRRAFTGVDVPASQGLRRRIAELDPGRRVVAGLLPAAHVPVDAGGLQAAARRPRAQQQMVDAQAGVAGEGVPQIVPEGVDRARPDAASRSASVQPCASSRAIGRARPRAGTARRPASARACRRRARSA